jgi:hydroxymethylpyrimidine pyrophosphatase-like HAD family hydrolase
LKYLAAAFDYDGTLASDGRVFPSTVKALRSLKESGRKLLMVTGRELDDLIRVFPELEMFDLVVAENGALIYNPATKEERKLTEDCSELLLEALKKREVSPINHGRCIISTWEPFHQATIDAIKELGLELQIIFNKGSVMVLPSGVNKGTGLLTALESMGLSPHNVIGGGDAENDHAFMLLCQVAVAVQNALPALKERADIITQADHGAGIEEMIAMLLKDEFANCKMTRHDQVLGEDLENKEVTFAPLGTNILIAGPSGGGKSNATLGILDTLSQANYQFCLIDPEGDYEAFGNAVVLGDASRAPSADEILQLLKNQQSNAIVNLLGLKLEDRPAFFSSLLPRLQEMRAEFGRPHYIVIDEVHHLFPKDWQPAETMLPHEFKGLLMITVHPTAVSPVILKDIDLVMAISAEPEKTIQDFAEVAGYESPKMKKTKLDKGQSLVWRTRTDEAPEIVNLRLSTIERRRHRRKYAEGHLPEERSFYFTGPHKLKLRAQNLITFSQLASGVDDDTWLYHLKRHEYSRWFEEIIKDETLAKVARIVEDSEGISTKEGKQRVLEAIEERYTLPVESK